MKKACGTCQNYKGDILCSPFVIGECCNPVGTRGMSGAKWECVDLDYEKIIGNSIHCETEAEADALLYFMDKRGYKWFSGSSLVGFNNFDRYKKISYIFERHGKSVLYDNSYSGRKSIKFKDIVLKNKKYTIDDIKSKKIAVHIQSKENLNKLVNSVPNEFVDENIKKYGFDRYESGLTIRFVKHGNYYGGRDFYENEGYEIIDFNQLILGKGEEKEMETKYKMLKKISAKTIMDC